MRKAFSKALYHKMSRNEDIVLITCDLGYGLWDKIKLDFPDRFYDVGSSEQLALGAAVGLSLSGKIPFVYSITPFLLFRPAETIRNYLQREEIPVKLVGGGTARDYGNLGFSHWSEDADALLKSTFPNISRVYPKLEEDMNQIIDVSVSSKRPEFIGLKK